MFETGIELEQSKSVGRRKLFCSSEIREKVKRTGKEINDWGVLYFSLKVGNHIAQLTSGDKKK